MDLFDKFGRKLELDLASLITTPYKHDFTTLVKSPEGFPIAMRYRLEVNNSLIHDPASGSGYIISLSNKIAIVAPTAAIMHRVIEKYPNLITLKTNTDDIEETLEAIKEKGFRFIEP